MSAFCGENRHATDGSQREDTGLKRTIPGEVTFLSRLWTIDELSQAVGDALGQA
jgi:hypothetical protein